MKRYEYGRREYDTTLKGTRRGICAIFTNTTFDELRELKSGRADEENLTATFEYLHFKVIPYNELKVAEMAKALRDAVAMVNSDDTCFVCCFNSHGGQTGIAGTDSVSADEKDLLTMSTIMSCINSNVGLKGKPKLIFVDACRGNKKGLQSKRANPSPLDKHELANPEPPSKDHKIHSNLPIPEEADFLLGYATSHGFESYTYATSVYFKELTKCLDLFANCADMLEILTMVNYAVWARQKEYIQTPAPVTTLKMKLFLRPQTSIPRILISDQQNDDIQGTISSKKADDPPTPVPVPPTPLPIVVVIGRVFVRFSPHVAICFLLYDRFGRPK